MPGLKGLQAAALIALYCGCATSAGAASISVDTRIPNDRPAVDNSQSNTFTDTNENDAGARWDAVDNDATPSGMMLGATSVSGLANQVSMHQSPIASPLVRVPLPGALILFASSLALLGWVKLWRRVHGQDKHVKRPSFRPAKPVSSS